MSDGHSGDRDVPGDPGAKDSFWGLLPGAPFRLLCSEPLFTYQAVLTLTWDLRCSLGRSSMPGSKANGTCPPPPPLQRPWSSLPAVARLLQGLLSAQVSHSGPEARGRHTPVALKALAFSVPSTQDHMERGSPTAWCLSQSWCWAVCFCR